MRRFKAFDVEHTQCTSQADHQHLLGVVQSGFGDYLVFNRLMRSVFAKRIMRTDIDALETHEHEVVTRPLRARYAPITRSLRARYASVTRSFIVRSSSTLGACLPSFRLHWLLPPSTPAPCIL